MSRQEFEQLLGGYATGTLTEREQEALMAAALEDQELFNLLMAEQPLKELLDDAENRRYLIEVLEEQRGEATPELYVAPAQATPAAPIHARVAAPSSRESGARTYSRPWYQRPTSWALGASGLAAAVVVGVFFSRHVPQAATAEKQPVAVTAGNRRATTPPPPVPSVAENKPGPPTETAVSAPVAGRAPVPAAKSAPANVKDEKRLDSSNGPRPATVAAPAPPPQQQDVQDRVQAEAQQNPVQQQYSLRAQVQTPPGSAQQSATIVGDVNGQLHQPIPSEQAKLFFLGQKKEDAPQASATPAGGSGLAPSAKRKTSPEPERERAELLSKAAVAVHPGIEYRIEQLNESGSYRPIEAGMVKRSDPIRVTAETNQTGYLYLMELDGAQWKRLYASGPIKAFSSVTTSVAPAETGLTLALIQSVSALDEQALSALAANPQTRQLSAGGRDANYVVQAQPNPADPVVVKFTLPPISQ